MGGYALAFVAHEFDDASAFMDRGLAVNPNMAQAWTFSASRYDMASSCAEKAIRDNPTFLHSICISAASNAFAGRLEPAQKATARALEFKPDLCASNLRDLAPFSRAEDLATFAKGLRNAGLPE
jgi:tetratricopeptide (TPR) repeat protein